MVLPEDRRLLGHPAGNRRGRGAGRPRRRRARAGGRVIRSRNPRIDVEELERRIEAELARDLAGTDVLLLNLIAVQIVRIARNAIAQ